MVFSWERWGGYECSSRGDERFSAFFATLEDGNSIEWHYQVKVKGYSSIRDGKGNPPKDTTKDLAYEYKCLWERWASMNIDLMEELREEASKHNGVLSDRFANTDVNQAWALSEILNEGLYLEY